MKYPLITAIRPIIISVSLGPVCAFTVLTSKSDTCMVYVQDLPALLFLSSGVSFTRYVPDCDGVNVNCSFLASVFPTFLNSFFEFPPLASIRTLFVLVPAFHLTVTLSFFCSCEMFSVAQKSLAAVLCVVFVSFWFFFINSL